MKDFKKYLIFLIVLIFLFFSISIQSVQAAPVKIIGVVKPTISFIIKPVALTTSSNLTIFGGEMGIIPTLVRTSSPDINLVILTNNKNGYTITIQDQGDGIHSGLYNSKLKFLIGSADYNYKEIADLSKNPGFGVQARSEQASIASRYDQSGNKVGGYERVPENLASYPGPADYHIITLTHKARSSGSTPAGTYVDIVAAVAIANF
jgi:hypothetical protein